MVNADGKTLPLYEWSICQETYGQTDFPGIIQTIISNRGLDDSLKYHSPFLMKGMNSAVERILHAVKNNQKILIHGDYDVDGIVGSVLLHRFMRSIRADVVIFLPTRMNHGYGLARDAIEKSKAKGISLIVTVDCGLSDNENVLFANSLGIDIVITDHHRVPEISPPATAVVHPLIPDKSYPYQFLSGTGVAYKLIQALSEASNTAFDENEYLPYVALSTIADIMPVTGENRKFIRDGIEALRTGHAPHLEILARAANISLDTISARDLAVHVASRLNAPGRLKTPVTSAQFLMERDNEKMMKLAGDIERMNSRRREIQEDLARKALEMASVESHLPIHILHDPDWHEGLLGTAASRVVDEYGHPVILLTKCENTGHWKGSGRAPDGVNLHRLIGAISELVEHFGGHESACGLTINGEQIGAFRKCLIEQFNLDYPNGQAKVALEISSKFEPDFFKEQFVEELAVLEPYGKGNPEPLFEITPLMIENANYVGGGNHLKLQFKGMNGGFDGILFSIKGIPLGQVIGRRVSIAATPKINEFNGKRRVEFQVRDISPLD